MNSPATLAYQRYTKTLYRVIRIFYRVSILCLILAAILCVGLYAAPDEILRANQFAPDHFTFELNGLIGVHYNPADLPPSTSFRPIYASIAGASVVFSLAIFRILQLLTAILKTTVDGHPFTSENGHRLTVIAAILLGAAFAFPAFSLMVSERIIQALHLSGLKTQYVPDSCFLLTALLMFVLSGIFRYGTFLQTEFDETL